MDEDQDDQDEEWYEEGPGYGEWAIPIYENGKIKKALEPRTSEKTSRFGQARNPAYLCKEEFYAKKKEERK